MKVVIFGGCGFLGSWLVKKLLDHRIKTVIFDYKIKKNILNQITNFSEGYVEYVQGDIKNSEQVFNVSNKGDILINLAGLMTPECSKNPIAGNEVNVVGSINVFQAAINQNNKFVIYTSSGGVFGSLDQKVPYPETHYGAFKLAVEGIARAYYLEKNLSTVGIRPFVIYGPHREIGGTAGISLACKAVAKGIDYKIPFSGNAGFVYVDDVTEIILKLIKKKLFGANIINVNGISCNVSEIVKILTNINNECKISIQKNNLPVVGEILGNTPNKYLKNFKYTSLSKGLSYTVNFYKTIL